VVVAASAALVASAGGATAVSTAATRALEVGGLGHDRREGIRLGHFPRRLTAAALNEAAEAAGEVCEAPAF